MNLEERIKAFTTLGTFLSQFSENGIVKKEHIPHNDLFFDGFKHQLKLAKEHNGWFTNENMGFALENWSKALTYSNIKRFIDKYHFKDTNPKKVAVIMAGNIPLVGFHDFFCVLLVGHKVLVKQSSNDKHLLPYLAKYLEQEAPGFKGQIEFTEEKLRDFDAVIATGSDNTARYFEYYFKGKPSIIRKNRNSVAVLTGNETDAELERLSHDIFRYYGLGCRNVSKLFVPKNYDFDSFFKAMYTYKDVIYYEKYANNYDYNKAVFLMSNFNILDNDFLAIKEDTSFASPISSVFYEYYNDIDEVAQRLENDKEKIQCVVSHANIQNSISFGTSQKPNLWDYADNVDTMKFLLSL